MIKADGLIRSVLCARAILPAARRVDDERLDARRDPQAQGLARASTSGSPASPPGSPRRSWAVPSSKRRTCRTSPPTLIAVAFGDFASGYRIYDRVAHVAASRSLQPSDPGLTRFHAGAVSAAVWSARKRSASSRSPRANAAAGGTANWRTTPFPLWRFSPCATFTTTSTPSAGLARRRGHGQHALRFADCRHAGFNAVEFIT